jgi:molecular chaperone DnaK (HSP70)
MAENGEARAGVEPSERVVIGLTFGNSNGSIAYTVDDKAEVIANEDGGMC